MKKRIFRSSRILEGVFRQEDGGKKMTRSFPRNPRQSEIFSRPINSHSNDDYGFFLAG